MYVTSAYYRGKSYFVHMYVDKQAILVSKIAPTVMVHTVQKRLAQKKLHFCLICGLIQRLGNFSLQLLSISLLSECLTYHTVRYLGENNGAFSDVTILIHQSKCGSIMKDSLYQFSILKVCTMCYFKVAAYYYWRTALFLWLHQQQLVAKQAYSQPHSKIVASLVSFCSPHGLYGLSWSRPWWWWGFGVKLLALK